jgi:uncharacterized protein YbjT (DUF2867 family)
MNIILGASGQIGSTIAKNLINSNEPVRAVIRNPEKAGELENKRIEVSIADYFDLDALKEAVKGGELIFLITPETGKADNVLGETKQILENYRKAIESSDIKSIIGLSSGGAQIEKHTRHTGNLLMSNMLEHEFLSLPINQVFVRPSYFYSNWLMTSGMAKEDGVLPTFYPPDLKMDMNSPVDVAEFIADKIIKGIDESEIIELVGPKQYSSKDVANEMAKVFSREVQAEEIPREEWGEMMKNAGFSDDATKNFIKMTELVAEGNANLEEKGSNPVELQTTLQQYFKGSLT